jgi:sulfur-oxidizing protein SoxB
MQYAINPEAKPGKRIQDMQLNGKPLQANKKYIVAGWASMAPLQEGVPIWDVVTDYLRDKKTASVTKVNLPRLKSVANNRGVG